MDIVTIHSAFVLGPVLSRRTDATSVSKFKASTLPVRICGAVSFASWLCPHLLWLGLDFYSIRSWCQV